MKTKKNVQNEINEIVEMLTTQELKPKVAGALKKRLPVLKECLMYLETNPTDEFVAKELERLDYLINKCMGRFVIPEGKIPAKEWSELRKEHENQYGIPSMRKQARILRYLLNSD